VVDPEGIEHYRLLRDKLGALDVRVHLVVAYSASATYNTSAEINMAPTERGEYDTLGEFSDDQLRELFDEFSADLRAFGWKERLAKQYYLNGIRNRMLHDNASPNPPCVALSSHLRLFPNGDVPTCQMNTETIGNLSRDSFEEVWFGTQALEQREWVRKCPGCWAECEIVPSAVFSGDLLVPELLRQKRYSIPTPANQDDSVGCPQRGGDARAGSEPQVYQVKALRPSQVELPGVEEPS
jgi:hypothetical protein